MSEQNATLASPAPARDVGSLQGKVAGAAGTVQFGGAPSARADANEASPDAPPAAPNPLQSIYPGPATQAMVIRTGEAFIEVDKVDPAVLKVRQLAAQVGGYIANSSISGGHDQIRQATIELKIPATKYEEAVGSLCDDRKGRNRQLDGAGCRRRVRRRHGASEQLAATRGKADQPARQPHRQARRGSARRARARARARGDRALRGTAPVPERSRGDEHSYDHSTRARARFWATVPAKTRLPPPSGAHGRILSEL